MFAPILLILINALIIMSINSAYTYKIASYINSFKVPIIQTQILLEQSVFNAVNDKCMKNFDICYDDTKRLYNLSNLATFLPPNTNFNISIIDQNFKEINIDLVTKEVVYKHNILNVTDRSNYIKHYMNKNYTFMCIDGSELPCNAGFIEKRMKVSNQLNLMIIERQISDLNTLLSQPENYVGEHNLYIAQINTLEEEKSVVLLAIQNSKIESFY